MIETLQFRGKYNILLIICGISLHRCFTRFLKVRYGRVSLIHPCLFLFTWIFIFLFGPLRTKKQYFVNPRSHNFQCILKALRNIVNITNYSIGYFSFFRIIPSESVLGWICLGPLSRLSLSVCYAVYHLFNSSEFHLGLSVFLTIFYRYKVVGFGM